MEDRLIVEELIARYGEKIEPVYSLPKAFNPDGLNAVKAIYLGCDPSNKHTTELPFAFAIDCQEPIFNKFVKDHTAALIAIGLDWNQVYAQNLCRNYFKDETSKNPIWKKVAREFWIEKINEEFSVFKPSVPVLLTSEYLYKALLKPGLNKYRAGDFYSCNADTPVLPADNLLGRPLLPFYRHYKYRFINGQHEEYRNHLIQYLSK